MAIRFKYSAQVNSYLRTAQLRFDLLREVTELRAERMHHARRIKEIDMRLAYLAKPLHLALEDLQREPGTTPTSAPAGYPESSLPPEAA